MENRKQFQIPLLFNPSDYQAKEDLDQFYYANFIKMKDLIDDRTLEIAKQKHLRLIDQVNNTQFLLAQNNNISAKKQGLRYWIAQLKFAPYDGYGSYSLVVKLDKLCYMIGRSKEIPNLYVRIVAFQKKSYQIFDENIFLVHFYEWGNEVQPSSLQQSSAVFQQQEQQLQIQVQEVQESQISRQQNDEREPAQDQIQDNHERYDDEGYMIINSTSDLDVIPPQNNVNQANVKREELQQPSNQNASLQNPSDLLIFHLSPHRQNIDSRNTLVNQQIKMEDQQQHQQQQSNRINNSSTTENLQETNTNNEDNTTTNNNQQNSTMVLENVQTRTQLKIETQESQQLLTSDNINSTNNIYNNNNQNQNNRMESPQISQLPFQPMFSSENYMNQNYLNQQNSLVNQIQQQNQLIIQLQQQLQQKNREMEQQKQTLLSKIKIRDDKINFLEQQEQKYETIISDLQNNYNNNNNNNNNMNL